MGRKLTSTSALGSNSGKCTGGRSFGCKHEEHDYGRIRNIVCMKCKTRMGCFWCCQIPRELVCLNCHEWAHPKALAAHGPMVHDLDKKREAMKIVQMRYRGQIGAADADRLFKELFVDVKKLVDNPPF